MKKMMLHLNLPLSIFKEGKTYVAYTPVLDLSTCGKTFAEAERRFNEAVEIFFEEMLKKMICQKNLPDFRSVRLAF